MVINFRLFTLLYRGKPYCECINFLHLVSCKLWMDGGVLCTLRSHIHTIRNHNSQTENKPGNLCRCVGVLSILFVVGVSVTKALIFWIIEYDGLLSIHILPIFCYFFAVLSGELKLECKRYRPHSWLIAPQDPHAPLESWRGPRVT